MEFFDYIMFDQWFEAKEKEYNRTAESFKLVDNNEYWKNIGKALAIKEARKYIGDFALFQSLENGK